jgi:hypothetical protein
MTENPYATTQKPIGDNAETLAGQVCGGVLTR